ncbi:MAG: hypothetical protein C9356_05635 [Oleiphilus sp.]|nr:MAG: hypothetical protein C9356_05635 [Oleiphilus sp.]
MIGATEQVKLHNGIKITVPAGNNLITNYVLKEQGDWFEHEIHFVREFIKPDMHVLDIGANYGLYATAIANNLTDGGHLWCFEPTPSTTTALRETFAANGFSDRVTLIEAGLSDNNGQASFYVSENSELNSLYETSCTSGEKITIDLVTLDDSYEKYRWPKLDFIKLDAEGEELNILKKGKKTLSECSPLIMFEFQTIGSAYNVKLIHAFKTIGYSCYSLVSELNILVPFEPSQSNADAYLLNLFCCKDDTAAKLRGQGILVDDATKNKSYNGSAYSQLSKLRYFKEFNLHGWQEVDDQYKNLLEAYNHYRDAALSKKERYENLLYAFDIVKQNLNEGVSNILVLSTYMRVAFDIGQQALGMQIGNYIVSKYLWKATPFRIDGGFVPASDKFESVSVKGGSPHEWLLSSVIDALIRKSSHSSFYNGESVLPFIETLSKLNFLQDDITKRKDMIEARNFNPKQI